MPEICYILNILNFLVLLNDSFTSITFLNDAFKFLNDAVKSLFSVGSYTLFQINGHTLTVDEKEPK